MKTCSIILILFITLLAQTNLVSADVIDNKILFHTFNGEYFKADSLIAIQIQQNQNHPKYYYLRANLAFYSRYFGPREIARDSLIQIVATSAQKAVDVAKELEENVDIKFYLGSAYSLLSRAHFMKDRSVYDGYTAARKSRNYLEDVIKEDPNYYDAYLGLAVLEYFNATRLSGWQKVLGWFLQMSGEKEKAMEYFTLVEEKGNLLKDEATFVLAILYRYLERDLEKVMTYTTDFSERFPQNSMINGILTQVQLEKIINEKGVNYFESAISSLRTQYNITDASVLNGVGYSISRDNDLETAISVYQMNVNLYPEIASTYGRIGGVYLQLENNDEAVSNYRIGLQKIDSDTTLDDRLKEYYRNSFETQLKELNALESISQK